MLIFGDVICCPKQYYIHSNKANAKLRTMLHVIRAGRHFIRANCLFTAAGWKEWEKKKEKKQLLLTLHQPTAWKKSDSNRK